MRTPKHTTRNVQHLAEDITDTMPQEIIVQAFYEDQLDYYKNDKEAFLTDWKDSEMGDKLETYEVEDE
jgi:hypothetical protein